MQGLSASDKLRFSQGIGSALDEVDLGLSDTTTVEEVNALQKNFKDKISEIMEEAQALADAKLAIYEELDNKYQESITAINDKFTGGIIQE